MEQQTQFVSVRMETCVVCGRKFNNQGYLDHLFLNKDCMRRYWDEEEKNHISRLRQRTSRKNLRIPGTLNQA